MTKYSYLTWYNRSTNLLFLRRSSEFRYASQRNLIHGTRISVSARSWLPSLVTEESIKSSGDRSGDSKSSICSRRASSLISPKPAAFLRSIASLRPSSFAFSTRCSERAICFLITSSRDLMLTEWQVKRY